MWWPLIPGGYWAITISVTEKVSFNFTLCKFSKLTLSSVVGKLLSMFETWGHQSTFSTAYFIKSTCRLSICDTNLAFKLGCVVSIKYIPDLKDSILKECKISH